MHHHPGKLAMKYNKGKSDNQGNDFA